MILDEINKKIVDLYKSGESETRTFLQTIKSQILTKAKDLGKDLDDNEVIAVLKSEKKQLEQSMEQFKSAGREDLVDKISKELEIIKSYLPEELSDEKLAEIIDSAKEAGDDFGKLMKKAMEKVKGQADGSRVAGIVKKVLQG